MATASMTQDPSTLSVSSRRRLGQPIPHEGENGLFSQSWFPICLSSEVQSGQILGSDFLDGRVVVFRGESEDIPILQTIRFQPGTLTQSDKALAKFFQYLRSYPRAHPSAEFIV